MFALQVLGQSMAPEFEEGEIIVIEPEGALRDGSFVLAQLDGEWIFRQLRREGERWALHALNPAFAARLLPDLAAVRGVVIRNRARVAGALPRATSEVRMPYYLYRIQPLGVLGSSTSSSASPRRRRRPKALRAADARRARPARSGDVRRGTSCRPKTC